jgi:hypothetical protein
MAETVGTLVLAAVGLAELGAVAIVGTLTVATVVGSAVLLAGAIGLQLLLARRPSAGAAASLAASSLPPAEAGHAPLKQSIGSRVRGYGRNRLAGIYMLYEELSGDSYDVGAFHHGRISGIVGYYLHDDVVEIDGSGIVQEQGDGRYGGTATITIQTRLGLDTETAYSALVTAFTSSAIWTNSHRGDGLASYSLVCKGVLIDDYTTIYPRGLPQLSIVADCALIYDDRDEEQIRSDPSTWKVNSNPVVQAIECLTSEDSGFGFDYDTLILPVVDTLNAEADLCDEGVTLAAGGTEPRYKSDGFFALDSDPVDVLSAILDTCDGWLSENGDGTLALKVGSYRAPTFTLEGRHIKGFSLQYGVADEELVNEIAFAFTSTAADYKTLPGDPWRDEDDISRRGKTRSQNFPLPWVQSHSQGRRLSKRKMAKLNAPLRGTIKTTLYGIQAMGERWIEIDAPDVSDDLSSLIIEVMNMKIDFMNAEVTFDFIKINPNEIDAWDETEEEGTTPTIPDKLVSSPPPLPANFVATLGLQAMVGKPWANSKPACRRRLRRSRAFRPRLPDRVPRQRLRLGLHAVRPFGCAAQSRAAESRSGSIPGSARFNFDGSTPGL